MSETPANADMVEGYLDGFRKESVPPEANRSASYRHGWLNGRDDRLGKPRAAAETLLRLGDEAMTEDRE